MIKTKTIKTDKAEILVIGGLPEEVDKWWTIRTIKEDVIISLDESDKDIWGEFSNPRYVFDLPHGKWQTLGFLKDIPEDVAKELVPEEEYQHLPEESRWYEALLHSLVEANCKLENKYGRMPNPDDFGSFSRHKEAFEAWQEEQEKVFTNPFLLKIIY